MVLPDVFQSQDSPTAMYAAAGLDCAGIVAKVFETLGRKARRDSRAAPIAMVATPSRLPRPRAAMQVVLAQPRGFCAGVVRAISIVEQSLEKYGAPIYVRHEIVHNKHVVDGLKAKGARFVDELSEVPEQSVAIFSAHGVSRAVEQEAAERGLTVHNATCPLVTKIHNQGRHYVAQGRTLVLIGHVGHPEVEGTMGQVPGPVFLVQSEKDVETLDIPIDAPVAYVTQTTLSVDDTKGIITALELRFRDLVGPDTRDICYATQNRQTAVRELCRKVDVVLVVGAANSSNSNRLREIAEEMGVPAHLIAHSGELRREWVENASAVGVTAGASAPEILVQGVVDWLGALGPVEVSTLGDRFETVEFRLPSELENVEPLRRAEPGVAAE
jgi:4-hydroxy-3-methylbut-2-enyl diphosphate reductase